MLYKNTHAVMITVVIPLRSWLQQTIYSAAGLFILYEQFFYGRQISVFSILLCIFSLPSVTRGCWWFLSQYRTAVYTKWPAATGTTVCLSCVGNTLAQKHCCSAQEASTARVWLDCSSRRIPPQQVCIQSSLEFSFDSRTVVFCISGIPS